MRLRGERRSRDVVRDTAEVEETAGLAVLARLGLGAAHTMNNAFTTILGEVSLLKEHRKDDPLVSDACAVLLGEIERCTRLTRSFQARRQPSQSGSTDVDLVRVVCELGPLLDETLGRHHRLEVRAPDDFLPVAADARRIELLVLCLVQYAADHSGGGSRVVLAVEEEPVEEAVALRLFVTSDDLPEYAVSAFLDPEQAPDGTTRACLEAVASVVSDCGGSRAAAATAPDGWAALIHLPRSA